MNWNIIVCPKCHSKLVKSELNLNCLKCHSKYSIENGIPNLIKSLDKHSRVQEQIWSGKTYASDPRNPDLTTIQERFAKNLIQSLPLKSNAIVVDVGCFIGEKLWYLSSNKKVQGIGTDISMPALKMAGQLDIYGHSFVGCDLERMPFKDGSLDCILVFDVIEHLSKPEQGFAEVGRVLKPGGLFLLHIPLQDNKYSFFWWKQMLLPKLAKEDYEAVGHTPERMLTTGEIDNYLFKYQLSPVKKIRYNAFFVHFFDRELMRFVGGLFFKLLFLWKSPEIKSKNSSSKRPARSSLRTMYARYVVPIFEFLSWPDIILTKLGIGNTYFILSTKEK